MKQYRILLAAACCALISSVASAQTVGAIDTSFGTINTWATFNPSVHAVVHGEVRDLIELPDGKILGAGWCREPVTNADVTCLYRWTANGGAPDTSFGAGGVSYVLNGASREPVRVIPRKDGRWLVAGTCNRSADLRFSEICLAVVNENGNGFDISFGLNGKTVIPPPAFYDKVSLADLVLREDGSVLVGGTCTNTIESRSYCVARIRTNGTFDPAFGANNWSLTTPGRGDSLIKLIALPDGRFIATGGCGDGFQPASRVCRFRYSSSGSLEVNYSFDYGTNQFEIITDARVFGEMIFIVGYYLGTGREILATRRGTFTDIADPSYGGSFPTSGQTRELNIDLLETGNVNFAKILRDGSVMLWGDCNNAFTPYQCSARLSPHGVFDSSYGVGGRYEYPSMPTPFGSITTMAALAEGASGRTYRLGSCSDGTTARPCVQRILMGTQPARVCTMDIDGDGLVKPTTDGLILARVSLGLKGSAALAGALGAGASRTTWGQVLDYLVDQCGMNLLP